MPTRGKHYKTIKYTITVSGFDYIWDVPLLELGKSLEQCYDALAKVPLFRWLHHSLRTRKPTAFKVF